jgi:Coenzyme PQQ synthesis protein D (PqqD)
MNRSLENYAPKAREEDLVVESLGDETLVYDMRSHKALCLNRTAAAVWNRCDGRSTLGKMADGLEQELHTPVSVNVVWLAIEELGRAKLLSNRPASSVPAQALTRRAAIKKIGLGAAIALPLVTSILVPTAEASTTCVASQTPCSPGGVPCCNSAPCNCSGSTCLCG